MKWKILGLLAVLVLTLVACTGYNRDGRTTNNNVTPTRYNTNTGDGVTHNRTNVDGNLTRTGTHNRAHEDFVVSKEAADKIVKDIPEVDRVHVLTTRHNAYVAAGIDGTRDHHRTGRTGNMNNRTTTDGTLTNRATDGVAPNRNLNTGTTGTTGTTRNVNEGAELTDEVKTRIADIVKSVDKNIDNVYVSTNPDFYDLTHNYVEDVNAGRPIRGFFDQFGTMADRLFPHRVR